MGFGILKAWELIDGSVKASIWLLITALIRKCCLSSKFLRPEIYLLVLISISPSSLHRFHSYHQCGRKSKFKKKGVESIVYIKKKGANKAQQCQQNTVVCYWRQISGQWTGDMISLVYSLTWYHGNPSRQEVMLTWLYDPATAKHSS